MKTIKLVMIATLLTYTAVNIANAGRLTSKPSVNYAINLSFEKAIQYPELVAAMNQQLRYSMLVSLPGHTSWTATVVYQNVRYRITGSIRQWELFLNWQKAIKNFDVKSN